MPHTSTYTPRVSKTKHQELQSDLPTSPSRDRSSGKRPSAHILSPSSKRTKTDDLRCQEPQSNSNMYNFSSSKTKTVVDLTRSPPASPAKSLSTHQRSTTSERPNNPAQAPGSGPKKLVVKNFRIKPKSNPSDYANKVWKQLDEALDIILSQSTEVFSLEELYRGVENVCRQDGAPELFRRLRAKCTEHIANVVKTSLMNKEDSSPVSVLGRVIKEWTTWQRQMNTIRSVFYYMDRSYLLHSPAQPSIEELGINLFRQSIFSDPKLGPGILHGACDLVAHDRNSMQDSFDADLLKGAISMFHLLKVYTNDFEPILLSQSQDFFKTWAEKQSSSLNLDGYVEKCLGLLDSEVARCKQFGLEESTQRDLIAQIDFLAIEGQEAVLTEPRSVIELMSKNSIGSLTNTYKLIQRKNLAEKLKPALEDYVNDYGTRIVGDEKRESEMVVRLLQFKRKLDHMLEVAFQNHEALVYTTKQAFETFINKKQKSTMTWGTDNDKPGEMIAKYVDIILRGGIKAIPINALADDNAPSTTNEEEQEDDEVDEDTQITKQLDQVLDLFRFVHGKAVFEAFYKKDLAKRLLMQRSASADAEKSMLTRLRSECGANFTSKLEQMFKDMELAREENASYAEMLENRQKRQAIQLNVSVLSTAAWPTYPDVPVQIPAEIQAAQAEFVTHYKHKHTGRQLQWKHSLAHCQMKAHFPKGSKDLVVSAFQAIVLLCFNDLSTSQSSIPQQLTYQDIQAATQLPLDELNRTLQSLACAKYRVLTKTPKGKDVNPTDTFVVNLGFADPKMRIKINQIQLKETKEENKATHERVAADRQYETQAAIVRIMKAQKKIKHAILMTEVITATRSRGVLEPAEIKKQIDKLIDKDYMEREDDGGYSYVA